MQALILSPSQFLIDSQEIGLIAFILWTYKNKQDKEQLHKNYVCGPCQAPGHQLATSDLEYLFSGLDVPFHPSTPSLLDDHREKC